MEKDYIKAHEWYLLAANQGNETAEYELGMLYYNGKGVEQDYIKAYEWILRSANRCYHNAQNQLGILYGGGYGVEKSYHEAIKLFIKACEQGNVTAQLNLSIIYENGYGVDSNYKEAYRLIKLSSKAEHLEAQKKFLDFLLLKHNIQRKLYEYIFKNTQEGVSYLFFSNFLAFLAKELNLNNLQDELLSKWIIKYLGKYFGTINSDFSNTTIQEWFGDFFGDNN